jgi:hypothetical protein
MSINFQKKIFEKSKRIPLIYYEIPALQDYITRSQDTFSYGTAIGTALSLTYILSLTITFIISLVFLYYIMRTEQTKNAVTTGISGAKVV